MLRDDKPEHCVVVVDDSSVAFRRRWSLRWIFSFQGENRYDRRSLVVQLWWYRRDWEWRSIAHQEGILTEEGRRRMMTFEWNLLFSHQLGIERVTSLSLRSCGRSLGISLRSFCLVLWERWAKDRLFHSETRKEDRIGSLADKYVRMTRILTAILNSSMPRTIRSRSTEVRPQAKNSILNTVAKHAETRQMWCRSLVLHSLIFMCFLGVAEWCSLTTSVPMVTIFIVLPQAIANVVGSFHDIRLIWIPRGSLNSD